MGATPSFACCRVRIDPLDLDQVADRLVTAASASSVLATHLCNAHVLSLAERDDEYRAVLNQGTLNVADGAPVALAARRVRSSRLQVKTRPRGTALMVETVRRGVPLGLRHYLYGSTPETVERVAGELRARCPGADVIAESPPFRPLTDAERAASLERMRTSGAAIVWVGLGTPQQQRAVVDLAHDLSTVVVGVGAAFEFLAGTKPQAPRWMQISGLEWVFRLATEPHRLWRRYLVGNAVFLYGVIRHGLPLVERS